ncbi:MAG: HD family phosphohydrolase [Verrucomicrobiota bacterium]
MRQDVSKARTRKTRTRQKKSAPRHRHKSPEENPAIGLLIAAVVWIAAILLVGFDDFLDLPMTFDEIMVISGSSVFALATLFAAGLFIYIASPETIQSNSKIGLLASIVLIALIAARTILYFWGFTDHPHFEIILFLLPFAIVPLMATIMLNSVLAIASGIWAVMIMALMSAQTTSHTADSFFTLLVTGILVTVIAATTARNIKTRSKVLRTASVVGLAEIVCVLGFTALNWHNTDVTLVLHMAGSCILSAFFSALLVLLIMPALESLFNVATNITLLELSDLSHPLLQRLALEAPGTYHHSLVVANLSQAAADEIGANSLLARVSAYFHDVGKLTKPGLFAENISLHNNPHDNLSPSMSTLVITSHVKEGLSLAMLYKIPVIVRKAIREHHGTSVLSFFHHKAKEQLELGIEDKKPQASDRRKIDERNFRYTGPKPSDRESAIICLADAVEAASRSLEKPTPAHIEDLVDDIVKQRILDGQLDESGLKLSDLACIKRAFVFTLTNMVHTRIPYPKDENTDKQQPANPKTGQQKIKGTANVPGAKNWNSGRL